MDIYEARTKQETDVKKDFLKLLLITVILSILLIGINLILSPEFYWFYWPTGAMFLTLVISSFRMLVNKNNEKNDLIQIMDRPDE